MAYRNIFISNKATLKLKSNQLIVYNGENYSFPVEDIRSILIDDCYSTLSAKLISKLSEEGVCVIICNEKHTPSATLLPIGTYCRANKRITLQTSQTQPKLKRIWQEIVVAKIENQAKCLQLNEKENSKKLYEISKTVLSGDSSNREGYAARAYFKALFGNDFTRDDENVINVSLNYGYAIIRSYIAKTLVAYGLEPSLGIHHRNQLNQFNLADDIIEPFRPIVDNFVAKNISEWGNEFYTPQKAELLLLLNCAVSVNKKRHSLANSIDLMVQSVIASFENNNVKLKLPSLLETSFFDYD